MKKMKTLEINGVVFDLTDDGTVRFDEKQTLTGEQRARVKENSGVQDTLIVTITDDAASHTAAEIYAHIQSGGAAFCVNGTSCYNLSYVEAGFALFSFVEDDAHVYGVKVHEDGSCETIEFNIADAISVVSSWNDLKDKPFYEENEEHNILAEQDIAFAENPDYGNYAAFVSGYTLILGETYTVVWDGVAHQLEAANYESLGGVGIGNAGILGLGADTGEKFCIGCIGTDLYMFSNETNSSHKVSIYQNVTSVVPLDEKFLPMDAIDAHIEEKFPSVTQEEYDALVEAGTVDESKYYMIVG